MKIFTQVNRSQGMIRTLVGLKSRITLTKPLLNHYCVLTVALMLLLGGFSTRAWGAWTNPASGNAASGSGTTWYAVTGGSLKAAYSLTNGGSQGPQYSSSITLPCPGATLTFVGNTDANASKNHYIQAQYSTNNSSWTDVGSKITVKNKSGNVSSGSISLPENAKYIRIKRTADKYGTKDVIASSITVTMRQYLENPTGGDLSNNTLAFGSGKVDDANTKKTFTIAWCNVPALTYEVSGTGKDKVSVEINPNSEYGKFGKATVTVTYNRSAASTLDATLTIKNTYGSYSKAITLTGSTSKYPQTLSWNNESSIVTDMMKGATQNISATATSGLTVSYESSNTTILSIDANGKLTANVVGSPVTITAKQGGNYKYEAASNITKTFNVKTKDTPFFTPNGFSEGTTKALKVDDEVTLGVSHVSDGLNGDFRASATKVNNQDVLQITRNGNTITIKALREGTSTVTFTQTENDDIFEASQSYTFSVTKVDNTLALKGSSYNRYVEEDDDLTSFVTKNSNGTIHTSSTPAGIAHYDIANNAIVIDNSSNTSFNSTSVTIKIWQDATVKYAGIAEANAKTVTLTVKKYENAIYVKGNENYSNSIYVDSYDNLFTFTATNEDYTHYPIQVTQSTGTDIATYYPNEKVVYSSYKLGTATWSVTQPENYKYKAGNGSFTVTVQKADEATDCYVFTDAGSDNTTSNSYKDGLSLGGVGDVLTFQMKKRGYGPDAKFYTSSDGSNWSGATSISESSSSYQLHTIPLPENTRYIKFTKDGTDDPYIKDIKVTRATYLNTSNISITKQSDASTLVYPGTEGTGTLRINYSLANGGDLKIACDNEKFAFNEARTKTKVTLSDFGCSTGYIDVPVYYTSNTAGTDVAHVLVYNNVYRAEATITGTTVKRNQAFDWVPNTDLLAIGQEVEGAFISATLPERVATYVSSNASVIRVDNGTMLVAVGAGKAEITATIVGNGEYADAVDAKEIEVTSDLVQHIEWDQTFMNCKVGDGDRPLNAYATSDVDCATNNARQINYTSSDNTVATIVNENQLRVLKVGTAIITATQEGGDDTDGHRFARVTATRKVVVKDPNAPCEYYFYMQKDDKEFDLGWNAASHKSGSMTLSDLKGNEPRYIKFDYSGQPYNVIFTYYSGNIIVEEYINNGWIIKHELGTYTSNTEHNSGELPLDREATQIRITVRDGMGVHTIKNCVVALARYIESDAENNTVSFNAKVGETQTKHIKLSYSEIKDDITLTMGQGANSHFSVTPNYIEGDCGAKAKNVDIAITYSPTNATENEGELLTISDGRTNYLVTLKGTATKTDRHISWTANDENTAYTVETVQLSASALTSLNESAGNVVFFLNNNSTTGYIDGESVLSFDKAGVAYVTANTVADNHYNAAQPVGPKSWEVSLTPTTISTLPTIGEIVSGTAASDIELTGWQATNTVNNAAVVGVLTISDGDLTNVGENTITLHFEPNNTAMYEACDRTMNVTVVQRPITNEEIGTVSAGSIIYGQKLSDAVLSKTGSLEGELTWIDEHKDEVKEVGTYNDLRVRFTPNNGNVAFKDVLVPVEVTQATPAVTASPVVLTYGAAASSVTPSTETGSLNGAWSWADANMDVVLAVGNHTLDVRFTPTDTKNYSVLNTTIAVTVNKATPVMTPKAVVVTYGTAPSTVTLSTNSGLLAGTWSWNDANSNSTTLAVDNYELNVIFTPDDQGNYNVLNTKVVVTVNKADADATVTAAAITYGQKVSESELTKSGTTAGSWDWDDADKDSQLNAGNHELTIHFTPSNTDNYNAKDAIIILQVNKATPELSWTAAPNEVGFGATDIVYTANSASTGAITYTIIAGSEYASIDANTGALTIKKVGSFTVQASQEATTNYNVPENITQVVTINAPDVNEFIGNGDWNNPANWTGGIVPVDVAPDVVVSGELVINGKVTVGDLTIQPTGGVTIVDDGKLTVTGHSNDIPEYGDIHVTDDGELTLTNSANLKVNDFILDAKLGDGTKAREGASGQVENPGKMEIKGDAYFELALDPSGECSQGWYDFTVPFPVDALTGISRYHGDNLISITYNRNYALMEYDEAARAAGGRGWKSFKGTLQPGRCYTITIDDVDNVYRFKKTNDGAFNTAMTQSLQYTEGAGNGNLRGWNGLGNGTLQHINLGEVTGVDYVQIYDHGQNRYIPSALNEFTYVVGSAFFVQSPEAKPDMTYVAATTEENGILRVAKRYDATKDICLTLTKDGDEYLSDRMYVGASEDAQDSYEIGHDLAKMGTPTEAKVAQIWANEYGLKLCDVEMPLVNNSANCEINLFAPAAGNYELNVEEAPENTMLYLTYNGRAIWNLTYSPYVFDLTKGTTEGYGLKMYVMQVATDIEQSGFSDQNSVRKVLIDDVIYIVTPEGKMYDITGKSANY